jgi:predicted O-methyltransferase YrrM
MLEIGSYEGRSTLWFLNNILKHPSSSITCIDTFEGSNEHDESLKTDIFQSFVHNIQEYKNKVHILKGKSYDILKIFPSIEKFDIIYIDGSHFSHNVLEDAILSFSLLKKGGYMIFDDYMWEDITSLNMPKIGIDAFLQCYKGQYAFCYASYQLTIQKI